MNTRRDSRPRQAPHRPLQSGPTAFVLGTEDELAIFEPVLRQTGMGVSRYPIDPTTLDIEEIVLDEDLAMRIERAAMAVVLADVSGDDRLPLISFVDESLLLGKPLLVSCVQAGATEQAAICQRRERVIGIGTLGLLSGRKVIEVAATANTDARLLEDVVGFLRDAGLEVYRVQDVPGLVLARILVPLVNEAAFALSEGVAEAEAIETAVVLGANYPFGPLRWADEVGVDRILLAMEYLAQATGEERYRAAPLLRRMAQAGHIGKASGRGFFSYEQPPRDRPRPPEGRDREPPRQEQRRHQQGHGPERGPERGGGRRRNE
jgi:3-hydroxybutyryl-CoA dehydrogenase